MEMNRSIRGMENLCEKTEKSLEELKYWTWSELLAALRQSQHLLPGDFSRNMVDKYLDSLVARLALSCEVSPCPSVSSSDSSGIRLSCDTRSTESSKNSSFRTTWWFEDVVALDAGVIRELVKAMVSRSFDHGIISRFLFYYQKTRFAASTTAADQKSKIIEMVVEMLDSLDIRSVSYRSLFQLLRIGLRVNLSTSCRDKIECMIGLQLDEVTLDDLLVPAPVCSRKTTSCLYEVNLVLRLVNSFISKGVCCVPLSRFKKVGSLMDLYLAEVAPDPCLKPSKFLALIKTLPDSARDTYDGVYNAVNLYFEVHSSGLSEEQKMQVCSGLNYEKLSTEALNHLAQNVHFPPKSAVRALISQQRKLKGLLHDTKNKGKFRDDEVVCCTSTALDRRSDKGRKEEEEGCKQIVLYAKKLCVWNENEVLRAHLRGMQWRVGELEKVCRKMQVQMSKMMKSKASAKASSSSAKALGSSNAKGVPKLLCS